MIPAGLDNVIPIWVYPKVYEGLYDCPLLICLCTIMSHLTFSCIISLHHSFSYTQNGATPLYTACQNGHKQTVDVLLKNVANVNLTRTVSLINPLCTWTERVMVLCLDCVYASPSLCYPTMCNTGGPKSETIKFIATDGYLPLNTYLRR